MPPKKKGKKEEGEGKKKEEGEEAGAVKGVEDGGGLEEVIRAEKEAKKRFQELLRHCCGAVKYLNRFSMADPSFILFCFVLIFGNGPDHLFWYK
jgi:hypothetical protein